jgi:hypothetical protein
MSQILLQTLSEDEEGVLVPWKERIVTTDRRQ